MKIQTRFIPFVALAVLAGDQLLLNLQGDNTNGYAGSMNIGLDLTDIEVGASDTAGGTPP